MRPSGTILDLDGPETWPAELIALLEDHREVLLAWATGKGEVGWQDYDAAIYSLRDCLDGYSLIGWHCTRLTRGEMASIGDAGMQLPDGAMLSRRLDALIRADLLDETLALRLRTTNQANDDNRAGRLWFCFFPLRLAGESGIGRFFRHWGGEALYNSHEGDPETGAAIARIGVPCLIEALIPVSGMRSTRAASNVARRYLVHRGYETEEPIDLEGSIRQALPASSIRRIIAFPSDDFLALTGCGTWNPSLAAQAEGPGGDRPTQGAGHQSPHAFAARPPGRAW